ncbi:hypothetical protein ABEF92_006389 [Exophiala dermatitidis]|uniref:Uncharacterized protein n=1 Tax=Exophiala dermatitidis (strain ATCC 34100 / CBS 525.76 / NIH/UT8656) TaxID=858893 RepID=H6CA08_EXODN|nr:uncharacterized protein HMPREF1120_08763 [Exophiala dermatitidis NIH/UT8656]EHY60819.1 hypothetical protein HMPREF1120_08763 [Exophiala dermatitidis NIH/UT8656]
MMDKPGPSAGPEPDRNIGDSKDTATTMEDQNSGSHSVPAHYSGEAEDADRLARYLAAGGPCFVGKCQQQAKLTHPFPGMHFAIDMPADKDIFNLEADMPEPSVKVKPFTSFGQGDDEPDLTAAVRSSKTQPGVSAIWGPDTFVTTSPEVKEIVKEYIKEIDEQGRAIRRKICKNLLRNIKEKKKTKTEEDGEEEQKTRQTDPSSVATSEVGRGTSSGAQENDNGDNETSSTVYTSQAGTEVTDGAAQLIRPPPPTPPDTVFHSALSMPTLPALHQNSDPGLIEFYRVKRAQNPVVFDAETEAIKQRLVAAKIARGGSTQLLTNEYTVELASREDAATAERWATGRHPSLLSAETSPQGMSPRIESPAEEFGSDGASFMDTANGRLPGPAIPEAVESGEREQTAQSSVAGHASVAETRALSPDEQDEEKKEYKDLFTRHPHLDLEAHASKVDKKQADKDLAARLRRLHIYAYISMRDKKQKDRDRPTPFEHEHKELAARLQNVDLPAHTTKGNTFGMIEQQSFFEHQVTATHERRIITAAVKITQVYEAERSPEISTAEILTAVMDDLKGPRPLVDRRCYCIPPEKRAEILALLEEYGSEDKTATDNNV